MKITFNIVVLAICYALAACGTPNLRDPSSWFKPKDESKDPGNTPVQTPGPGATPTPNGSPIQGPSAGLFDERDVPVETFLTSGREVPARLRATQMSFSFRSNIAGAQFECRLRAIDAFSPCPQGSRYSFTRLRHGQQIALWVRARTPAGRVDRSPTQIGFVVDLVNGLTPDLALETAREEAPILDARNLPLEGREEDEVLGADGKPLQRQVQVGSFYAAAVPYSMYTATYSTSKTYNGALRMLRLMGRDGGGVYDSQRCDRTFERLLDGLRGTQYCEATPTRAQLAGAYPQTLPYNHVELVAAGSLDERVLVAAFDADQDPGEGRLGLNAVCNGSRFTGSTPVPLLHQFFGVRAAVEVFQWCQVRLSTGKYWWFGVFSAALTAAPDAPRLKVIYSVDAARGIFSGEQFASRAAGLLPKIVVPIAPAEEYD